MSRALLAVIVAAAGVTTVVHRHHPRTVPTLASAPTSWPLRASRAQERQQLPAVKPRSATEVKARHDPPNRGARPAVWQRLSLNWRALARCESTNNLRAVDPTGTYFGLYQFDEVTWRSVGGHGNPAYATAAEQTYRAEAAVPVFGRAALCHVAASNASRRQSAVGLMACTARRRTPATA